MEDSTLKCFWYHGYSITQASVEYNGGGVYKKQTMVVYGKAAANVGGEHAMKSPRPKSGA